MADHAGNNTNSSQAAPSDDKPTNNNIEDINSELNDIETAKKKMQFYLSEFRSTEESYIRDLSILVNGYMAELHNMKSDIPVPEDLKGGKVRIVFGNIKVIYVWHRDCFMKALRKSLANPSEFGLMMKRFERNFDIYHEYCQNKQVSEYIVTEHSEYFAEVRKKLNHNLYITDMLIKPMQRITKYEILLNEIQKHTKKAGLVKEAHSIQIAWNVMKNVCKTLHEMMLLTNLDNFEGYLRAQGLLMLQDRLYCTEQPRKGSRGTSAIHQSRELQVFLFEQIMIFCGVIGGSSNFGRTTFVYVSQIQVNQMEIAELPDNGFIVKSTNKTIRPDVVDVHCIAADNDKQLLWVFTIQKMLQDQQELINALQDPIAHV